jgi:site-specific recombinase XerD
MRLERAIEGYWLARRRDLSQGTIRDYELTFRRLVGAVGKDVEVGAITSGDINDLLNYLIEDLELSKKTVLNAWIALSSFWTWAEKELEIPHVIRDRVERPKPRKTQILPFTEAEVRAMLHACDTAAGWDSRNGRRVSSVRPTALRDKTIMLVLLDVGLRVSELCDLRIEDYKQKRGQVHIRSGKGDKERILYLGDVAKKFVWRYLNGERESAPKSAPLFATRDGAPMDRYNVRRMISRAGERAGVMGAYPHRFRHTFAINALRNGMNLLEVKELLGHETLATVQIYAKLAAIDLENAQRRYSVADRWGL